MSKANENRKTIWDKVVYFFTWISMNYSVHMNTYMMEPWERRIFNGILLASVITGCYTAYIFLPAHCMMIMSYLGTWKSSNTTAEIT